MKAGRTPEELACGLETTARSVIKGVRRLQRARKIRSEAAARFARRTDAVPSDSTDALARTRPAGPLPRRHVSPPRRRRVAHARTVQTGVPRIHAPLKREGEHVGRRRAAQLMRLAGLYGAGHRH
jgi:hypothetical protein